MNDQPRPPLNADTPAASATPGSEGAFAPFRSPVFRAIWIANLCSHMGSLIQSVAAAWLMTELTHSKQLIAAVAASASLPILLLGVIAGAIADNYDRRQVMMAAQIAMLITSSVLAMVTYLDLMNPFLLLTLTICVGIGTALNAPAWQASVRQQVPPRQLPQAIALNTVAFNLARSTGPAIGGLLISLWDVSLAFALNALSYVALIGVLLWWRPEPRARNRRPILPAVAVGIRYCATTGPLRNVLLRGLIFGISLAAFHALMPAIVRQQLEGNELQYGAMLCAFGAGSIMAASFVRQLRRRIGLAGILAIAAVLLGTALSIIAEVHTVSAGIPASLAAGLSWVLALTSINTAVQLRSPDEILGRCLSIYQSVTIGGMAIGAWLWGTVADIFTLPFALHAASVFLVVGLAVSHFLAPLPKPGEGVVKNW